MPDHGPHALGLVAVLQHHRHAVERPPRLAARRRLVGRAGAAPRPVRVERDDGVEFRVVPLDLAEMRLEHLDGAHLAVTDRGGEAMGGGEDDGVHGSLQGG